MIKDLDRFWTYYYARGIGDTRQFDFSVRHYAHYTLENLEKIAKSVYNIILESDDIQIKKWLLTYLYYAITFDMIPKYKRHQRLIPYFFQDIETKWKKYFPKLLIERDW